MGRSGGTWCRGRGGGGVVFGIDLSEEMRGSGFGGQGGGVGSYGGGGCSYPRRARAVVHDLPAESTVDATLHHREAARQLIVALLVALSCWPCSARWWRRSADRFTIRKVRY